MIIDDEHKKIYQKIHEQDEKHFEGRSLQFKYADTIKAIVDHTKSATILDYGCGKARRWLKDNYHKRLGLKRADIKLFDPGYKKYEVLPEGKFDGVICTDVLEHISEDCIDDALDLIFEKATKFVFFAINCGLAKKVFENGENAHCLAKPPEWWNDKLRPYFDQDLIVNIQYVIPKDPKLNIYGLVV